MDEYNEDNLTKIEKDVKLSTDIIVNGTYKDNSGANVLKLSRE
ncbi:MAG: hypothetical protein RR847_01690 [Bacilli bacterium]